MPPETGALERLIDAATADPAALAVVLFGSAARGEPARDLDVSVLLDPRANADVHRKSLEYAAHSSGRRHEGLDATVFQALPLYVRERVLREGKVLWTRDWDALSELARITRREWNDFRPHYEMYLEEVARG